MTLNPRLIISIAALMIVMWQSIVLIGESREREAYAYDLAELHHAKHGLLNPNEWVKIGSRIVSKEVDEFELTPAREDKLRVVIKQAIGHTKGYVLKNFDPIIDRLFDTLEQKMGPDNIVIRNVLLVLKGAEMRQNVRSWLEDSINDQKMEEMTKLILEEVKGEIGKPASKESMKTIIMGELERLEKNTATLVEQDALAAVMTRHGCSQRSPCQDTVREKMAQTRSRTELRGMTILGVCTFVFTLLMTSQRRSDPSVLITLIAACALLWVGGVFTPMLQVEAQIKQLDLQVAGETVQFSDQLLFYQSKSIIDFVLLLVETGQVQLVIVGILVGLFSVVFPLLKMTSSFVYLRGHAGLRQNPFLRFFALKSGKWSMADVMVVALFMAYIGFTQLIDTQMKQVGAGNSHVDVLATDGTQLLIGFFLFLGFCVASLLVSTVLDTLAHGSETSAGDASSSS